MIIPPAIFCIRTFAGFREVFCEALAGFVKVEEKTKVELLQILFSHDAKLTKEQLVIIFIEQNFYKHFQKNIY
jgi:hypothetical protein